MSMMQYGHIPILNPCCGETTCLTPKHRLKMTWLGQLDISKTESGSIIEQFELRNHKMWLISSPSFSFVLQPYRFSHVSYVWVCDYEHDNLKPTEKMMKILTNNIFS